MINTKTKQNTTWLEGRTGFITPRRQLPTLWRPAHMHGARAPSQNAIQPHKSHAAQQTERNGRPAAITRCLGRDDKVHEPLGASTANGAPLTSATFKRPMQAPKAHESSHAQSTHVMKYKEYGERYGQPADAIFCPRQNAPPSHELRQWASDFPLRRPRASYAMDTFERGELSTIKDHHGYSMGA